MDRRIGQLAGVFGVTLVILRLNRLLLGGPGQPDWQIILIASAVLGAVVWWLLTQLLTNRWVAAGLFAVGAVVIFLRIAVPETLTAGVIPTAATPEALGAEMEAAIRLIRFGVPPIEAVSGVLAILAVLMWVIGSLYTWGVTGGPVATMMVPSLVVYLQFAVFDRQAASTTWMLASAALLTLTVVALGLERREDSGRARDIEGRPLARRSHALALITAAIVGVAAALVATGASGVVSEYGNLPWRSSDNVYGLGGGGVTYDRFVDLQQQLVDLPETVLFNATLAAGAPPGDQIYWRMEAFDEFDGVRWRRSSNSFEPYSDGDQIGDPVHEYRGTTADILYRVHIAGLRQDIAPSAGNTTRIDTVDLSRSISPGSFRTGQDSALIYQSQLGDGDIYQGQATYTLSSQDLGALATDEDGELSQIFANASAAGQFTAEPQLVNRSRQRPDEIERFTRLPDDLPTDLRIIAFEQTRGATTDFEKAWMLEHWFQNEFDYSTDVTTGHSSLNLADWLADPDSINYRTGYCEQFSTSMAVLGRELGIPSRVVWGFTPGTTEVNDAGTEVTTVRGTNAHAWVEMWMDGFGWVRFDPTPRAGFAQPIASFDPEGFVPESVTSPEAPSSQEFSGNFGDELAESDIAPVTQGTFNWWPVVLLTIALAVSVVPGIKTLRRRRRVRLVREGDITAAWDEIVDRLTDLGEPVSPSMTPMEVARATDPALLSLATGYSAAVYGGRAEAGSELDLLEVEAWLHESFDAKRRAVAAIRPTSLLSK